MAVSESDRHELYAKLEDAIGKGPTETMMSLLPPVGWADVATKRDLEILESRLEAKFSQLEAKFSRLEARFSGLEGTVGSMESRLNERMWRTALTVNIPTILASFALAFTAIRFA